MHGTFRICCFNNITIIPTHSFSLAYLTMKKKLYFLQCAEINLSTSTVFITIIACLYHNFSLASIINFMPILIKATLAPKKKTHYTEVASVMFPKVFRKKFHKQVMQNLLSPCATHYMPHSWWSISRCHYHRLCCD